MAIGWLAILQSVPWTEVVRNAPKVADGAKKLWNAVANKKPPPPRAVPSPADNDLPPEALAIAALQREVAVLVNATADLHSQVLASSELIKTLADQNIQLVRRVEANRTRVLWLTGAVIVLGVLVGWSVVLPLVR